MSPAIQREHSIQKICQAIVRKGDTPDTNTFIVSTGDRDRDNDTLDPNGWELAAYQCNPVMFYGHAHGELPVAKCVDIKAVNSKLRVVAAWPPPGIYPFADTVKGMVQHGFLRSTSVGFRAIEWTPNQYGGRDYTRQELLEVSIVPIPSNPHVTMEKGVDRITLKNWLGHKQNKEDEMDTEMWIEINDGIDTKDDDHFAAMCRQMLEAYSEMDSHKFAELMARQLALLGPAASIADLLRGIMQQGVVAPKSYDIDERQLATLIAGVIAQETANATKAALNAALGRLD